MTAEEALQLLGHLCAASVGGALRELVADAEVGTPVLVQPGFSPLASVPPPGLVASVELDDGLAGESTLVVPAEAAPLLAVPPADADAEAAVRDAAIHVAAAVAATIGGILGQDLPIGAATVSPYASEGDAADPSERSPHAVALPFTLAEQAGRFLLSVQNAFLVKATPALAGLADESEASVDGDAVGCDTLRDVQVRVWAELGRAQLPLAQAVGLPGGAVVQLDRGADDPIELFVNGRLFAHGRLTVVDGEWAVEIDELVSGTRGEATAVVAAAPPQPVLVPVDNGGR